MLLLDRFKHNRTHRQGNINTLFIRLHVPPLIERGYGIALMRALPRLHVQVREREELAVRLERPLLRGAIPWFPILFGGTCVSE